MHFTAALPTFYKSRSKKIGLNIWMSIPNHWYEYTSGYNTKLQQPGYYDVSTLTLSSYAKDLYWGNLWLEFLQLKWS